MLNTKTRKHSKFIISAALFLIIICVSPARSDALKKVSFIPQWVPQAQFAGYYIGLEKGIYRKHGIDLTIITGGRTIRHQIFLQMGGRFCFALAVYGNSDAGRRREYPQHCTNNAAIGADACG